jgi:hypothetical protein
MISFFVQDRSIGTIFMEILIKIFTMKKAQTLGSIAHKSIDSAKYSSRKNILQGIAIISHEFGIQGKIDLYDARTGILTERKRKINKVYR